MLLASFTWIPIQETNELSTETRHFSFPIYKKEDAPYQNSDPFVNIMLLAEYGHRQSDAPDSQICYTL